MLRQIVLSPLLRIVAKRFSERHPALAFLFFRALGDGATLEHARAAWFAGDVEAAERLVEDFLAKQPDHPEGNNLKGAILLKHDRVDEAEASFRRALNVRPRFAAARTNLGNVLQAKSDIQGAIECYRRALDVDPRYVEALTNLGGILNHTGEYLAAERHCRDAIECAPDLAGAWSNLGNALLSQGREGDAVAAYREALRLDSKSPEALINLFLVLQEPAYLVGVMDHYEGQLKKNPDDYLAHVRLAQALQSQDQCDEGREHLLSALAIRPDAIDARLLLGHNLARVGDAAGAIDEYRRVPRERMAINSLVFNVLYLDEISGVAAREEARNWARLAQVSARFPPPVRPGRRPGPLRIGYVSKDFFRHSVAYFLEPIIEQHDRREVFVVCYSTLVAPDEMTERFQSLADLWRDISLRSLDEVEDMIREDEIDILVDLSGHTNGNRLALFARRPAPVQATYLGHPGTTGVANIDYRIGDEHTDPPGLTEDHYVERLWRLPGCFLSYRPSGDAPDVADAPVLQNQYVTFGSFNAAIKVTGQVIDAWAQVLAATPNAVLVLKSFSFASRHGRDRVFARFAAHGIAESRIQLQNWRASAEDHLGAYGKIDIALDPFPYNGTTTTCEALWMGVPVVTLAGDRHSSRVGASLLHTVGLDDLICSSTEQYVATAVALANDPARLRDLRASLRDRMRASPLLDHAGFTRKLEAAYREMWRLYEQEAGADAAEEAAPEGEPIRLHIGGQQPKEGWKILNINPGPHVDYVGDIRDLSGFPANSVAEVYASHVLEHVDQNSILPVLRGIRRILRRNGGRLMISVPDLEVLCRQFLKEGLGAPQRVHIMRMMFGGQTDAHDYHQIGLYYEYLADLLKKAGFRDVERVKPFDLFEDTSAYAPYGEPISLNVIAVA